MLRRSADERSEEANQQGLKLSGSEWDAGGAWGQTTSAGGAQLALSGTWSGL